MNITYSRYSVYRLKCELVKLQSIVVREVTWELCVALLSLPIYLIVMSNEDLEVVVISMYSSFSILVVVLRHYCFVNGVLFLSFEVMRSQIVLWIN